jgi:tetratricopeptide (TPR) repeat protein
VNADARLPQLLAWYNEYLDRPDAARFACHVATRYTDGTLQRLTQSPHREARRAAVLALGILSDYASNAALGRALIDDDRTVRILAENAIRQVWARGGSVEHCTQLARVTRLIAARQFDKAVNLATDLIQAAPHFAEAWNQRAFAYHALGQYEAAVHDCHEALEINPYHFIAAVGMGRSYLELHQPGPALECFRRALRLNPDLDGVRVQVEKLARRVDGRG